MDKSAIKNTKMNSFVDYFVVFLIVASTRIYIAINTMPVYTISDEVSAMSIAAKLAGYDWTDVVSNAGYYGIGYLFIFAPLFMLGISSITIYKIIVLCSGAILGSAAIVCYRILKTFFQNIDRMERITISSACGCLSIMSTYQPSMRNEEMLILVCWLIVLNMFYILSDRNVKSSRIWVIGLCLYSLTLHERAIIFILCLFVVCIIMRIYYKKVFFPMRYLFVYGVGYALIKWLLQLYRTSVWEGIDVKNASIASNALGSLSGISFDKNYIKALVTILTGQLYTAYATSGGIFLISVISIVCLSYKMYRLNKGKVECSGTIIVGCWLLIGIFCTIAGLMVTWGDSVYVAFNQRLEGWQYGYKAFTYMRYPGFLMPPLFMIGFVVLKENADIRKNVSIISGVVFAVISIFWLEYVGPYIYNQKSLLFITNTFLDNEQKVSESTWMLTAKILFIVVFIWIFFLQRKRGLIYISIALSIYASAERVYAFNNCEKYGIERTYSKADAGSQLIENIEREGFINDVEIYCVDMVQTEDHQVWYLYQFMNYNVHIIPAMPDRNNKEKILLTNKLIDDARTCTMQVIQLDENEFVYYEGKEIEQVVRKYYLK